MLTRVIGVKGQGEISCPVLSTEFHIATNTFPKAMVSTLYCKPLRHIITA